MRARGGPGAEGRGTLLLTDITLANRQSTRHHRFESTQDRLRRVEGLLRDTDAKLGEITTRIGRIHHTDYCCSVALDRAGRGLAGAQKQLERARQSRDPDTQGYRYLREVEREARLRAADTQTSVCSFEQAFPPEKTGGRVHWHPDALRMERAEDRHYQLKMRARREAAKTEEERLLEQVDIPALPEFYGPYRPRQGPEPYSPYSATLSSFQASATQNMLSMLGSAAEIDEGLLATLAACKAEAAGQSPEPREPLARSDPFKVVPRNPVVEEDEVDYIVQRRGQESLGALRQKLLDSYEERMLQQFGESEALGLRGSLASRGPGESAPRGREEGQPLSARGPFRDRPRDPLDNARPLWAEEAPAGDADPAFASLKFIGSASSIDENLARRKARVSGAAAPTPFLSGPDLGPAPWASPRMSPRMSPQMSPLASSAALWGPPVSPTARRVLSTRACLLTPRPSSAAGKPVDASSRVDTDLENAVGGRSDRADAGALLGDASCASDPLTESLQGVQRIRRDPRLSHVVTQLRSFFMMGILAGQLRSEAEKPAPRERHGLEVRHAELAQALEENKDVPGLKPRPSPLEWA